METITQNFKRQTGKLLIIRVSTKSTTGETQTQKKKNHEHGKQINMNKKTLYSKIKKGK